MSVAALLATASSVTATLYASEGLTTALAEVGQFPTAFGRTSRLGHHGGLWITTVSTLLFVNVFDLGAPASIGSAVSLAVFVVVLVAFAVDTCTGDPEAFWAMVILPFLALGLDAAWKRRQSVAVRSG